MPGLCSVHNTKDVATGLGVTRSAQDQKIEVGAACDEVPGTTCNKPIISKVTHNRPSSGSAAYEIDLISSQPIETDSSQSMRQHGRCSICFRTIACTNAGVVFKHGPGCPGSGLKPIDLVNTNLPVQGRGVVNQPHMDIMSSGSFLDILSKLKSGKILKRIPRGSHSQANDIFHACLSRVNENPDNVEAWFELLSFTRCCLLVPGDRGGKKHAASLATKVNHQLETFPSIISSPKSQPALKTHSRIKQKSEVDKLRSKVSEKIEEGDVKGAIRLTASDDTLAPFSPTTFEALKLKHPPRSISIPSTQNSESPSEAHFLVLDVPVISAAVKSFPNGSVGGVDGLRPQHLKDMLSPSCGFSSTLLLTELTCFSNICLEGRIPVIVRPVFGRCITLCFSEERRQLGQLLLAAHFSNSSQRLPADLSQ